MESAIDIDKLATVADIESMITDEKGLSRWTVNIFYDGGVHTSRAVRTSGLKRFVEGIKEKYPKVIMHRPIESIALLSVICEDTAVSDILVNKETTVNTLLDDIRTIILKHSKPFDIQFAKS